jgi:hypothetical protein
MENEDNFNLETRWDLIKIKQDLVLNKPRKVIRQLNRIDRELLTPVNRSLMAFLYFTAFRLEDDTENTVEWRSEVSLVDMKEANYIYQNIKE